MSGLSVALLICSRSFPCFHRNRFTSCSVEALALFVLCIFVLSCVSGGLEEHETVKKGGSLYLLLERIRRFGFGKKSEIHHMLRLLLPKTQLWRLYHWLCMSKLRDTSLKCFTTLYSMETMVLVSSCNLPKKSPENVHCNNAVSSS